MTSASCSEASTTIPIILLDTKLAEAIGLHEAITLRQILYQSINHPKAKEKNGEKWFRASYNELLEQLSFLSRTKLTSVLSFLKKEGWLLAEKLNKRVRDQTRWYSVNQEKMRAFSSSQEGKPKEKLIVNPSLAKAIGLEKSIVLEQLSYWIEKKRGGAKTEEKISVYNSYEEWREQLSFLSQYKIGVVFRSLEKDKIIESKRLSDGRKSCSLNEAVIEEKSLRLWGRMQGHRYPTFMRNSRINAKEEVSRPILPSIGLLTPSESDQSSEDLVANPFYLPTESDQCTPFKSDQCINKTTFKTNTNTTFYEKLSKLNKLKHEESSSNYLNEMVKIWNIHTKSSDTGQDSKKLESMLSHALRSSFHGSLESWEEYCNTIGSNDFLMGKSKNTEFKAKLEWVLKQETIQKIRDGYYKQSQKTRSIASGRQTEEEKKQAKDQENKAWRLRSGLSRIAEFYRMGTFREYEETYYDDRGTTQSMVQIFCSIQKIRHEALYPEDEYRDFCMADHFYKERWIKFSEIKRFFSDLLEDYFDNSLEKWGDYCRTMLDFPEDIETIAPKKIIKSLDIESMSHPNTVHYILKELHDGKKIRDRAVHQEINTSAQKNDDAIENSISEPPVCNELLSNHNEPNESLIEKETLPHWISVEDRTIQKTCSVVEISCMQEKSSSQECRNGPVIVPIVERNIAMVGHNDQGKTFHHGPPKIGWMPKIFGKKDGKNKVLDFMTLRRKKFPRPGGSLPPPETPLGYFYLE